MTVYAVTILVLLLIICLQFVGISCAILPNSANMEENLVADFLKYLLKRYENKKPLVAVAHDFEKLPDVFEDIFRNKFHTYSVGLFSRFDGMNDVYFPDEKQYWFAYMHSPELRSPDENIFHVFMFRTVNTDTVIKLASSKLKFQTNRHYFIFWDRDGNLEETLYHPRVQIWVNKIAVKVESPGVLELKSVCFYCDEGSPETVSIGKYLHQEPKSLDNVNIFPDFTRDMHGRFLLGNWINIITPEDITLQRSRYIPIYICQNTIFDVAKYLNFHFIVSTFEPAPDEQPAEIELKDGNWSGQSGAVFHEYADFGLCKVAGDNMLKVADYTTSIPIMDRLTHITRKPKPANAWDAAIQPYSSDMWAALFVATFVSSFIFCGLLMVIFKFHNPFPGNKRPPNLLLYSFRYLFSTLMEENPPLVPISVSARAFLVFWWLFSVVVICGYESKLISFLANPPKEDLPKTLYELYEWKDRWTWGMSTQHGPYFRILTGVNNRAPFYDYLESKMKDAGTMEECFMKSVYEDFSCMTIGSWLYMFQYLVVDREGNIPVDVHDELPLPVYLSPVLEKHGLFNDHFDNVLTHLWCAGLIMKYFSDYNYGGFVEGLKRGRAQNRFYGTSMALNVNQMSGAFYGVVIFAWLMPLLGFFWELYKFRKDNKKLEKLQRSIPIEKSDLLESGDKKLE